MLLYVIHDGAETVKGLGCLAVETNVAVEIQLLHFFRFLDDNGCAVGLSYQSQNLCMSVLAKDDNLLAMFRVGLILFADSFLQMQDNRACGIYDVNVVHFCLAVCRWWFSVCAEQYVCITQRVVCSMIYGLQTQLLESAAFLSVVHDVSQAIEFFTVAQFFLCLTYSSCYSEAETASFVNFNNHSCCSFIVMLLLSSTIASSACVRGEISR